jgi:MFS family permease
MRSRGTVISGLGIGQIFAWGSSYYLPAVLAKPIVQETGWPLTWVIGGLSLGLLVAGLVSPWMGRAIGGRGGRPVLMASTMLLAIGLCLLALAPSIPAYLAGWIVMGLGMGSGLYDPAFATLGRLYGEGARSAIGVSGDASRLARRLSCLCGHPCRGAAASVCGGAPA